MHLWFLYELIIFVFCFSILYKLRFIKNLLCKKISVKFMLIFALWLISTVPLAYILNNWWHPLALKASSGYFDLKIGNMLYYFSYFLAGVILYSNQNILIKIQKLKLFSLGFLSIFAFFVRVYSDHLTIGQADNLSNVAKMEFDPMLVLFNACMIGMNSVLFWLLFIGLASKFIKSGSAILSWFVELSYPICIIHIIPITMMTAAIL